MAVLEKRHSAPAGVVTRNNIFNFDSAQNELNYMTVCLLLITWNLSRICDSAGNTAFGSGWAWLSWDPKARFVIASISYWIMLST